MIYDPVITLCRYKIGQAVDHAKEYDRTDHTHRYECAVIKVNDCHEIPHHKHTDKRMQYGSRKRRPEHTEDLSVYRALNLRIAHAHFFHDRKTCLIFVAFGDLFIIHNDQQTHEKDQTEYHADK